jgi:Tat protein secretion system quality control protein TatD with DNase activity
VAACLASVRRTSAEALAATTTANALRLFGIAGRLRQGLA